VARGKGEESSGGIGKKLSARKLWDHNWEDRRQRQRGGKTSLEGGGKIINPCFHLLYGNSSR